jgi:hypothetical protein
MGYSFTNVDMCFGEGYANFGYFGMFLFLAVITLLMRSWTINMLCKMSFIKLFYIFLGFEFYLLRGDLYSSIKIMSSLQLLQV